MQYIDLYRPHPKDGGRYCFQFVCQFTPRRVEGVPQPGLDGGGGVPQPCLDGRGGTPARSGWWGGYPGQFLILRGYPAGLDGGGGYSSQVWMVWGVPQSGLDGGGYPGYPPP